MSESYYLLAAIFLPLLLAPVAYFVSRKIGINAATWFSFAVMALSTAMLLLPALSLHGGRSAYVESYTWSPFVGNFGLRLDGLSLPFAAIIYILFTVLTLYSKPYMLHKIMEGFREEKSKGHGFVPNHDAKNTGNPESGTGQNTHRTSGGTLVTSSYEEEQGYVKHHFGLYFGLFLTFSMGMLGTVPGNQPHRVLCILRTNACSIFFSASILWLWCKKKNRPNVLLLDSCGSRGPSSRSLSYGVLCRWL